MSLSNLEWARVIHPLTGHLPGTSRAGSIKSGRFVAPITNKWDSGLAVLTDNSASSWDTILSMTPPLSWRVRSEVVQNRSYSIHAAVRSKCIELVKENNTGGGSARSGKEFSDIPTNERQPSLAISTFRSHQHMNWWALDLWLDVRWLIDKKSSTRDKVKRTLGGNSFRK